MSYHHNNNNVLTSPTHQEGNTSPTLGSRKSSTGVAHSPYAHPALRSCDQSAGSAQYQQVQHAHSGSQPHSASGSSSSHGSDNGELAHALPQPQVAPPSHSGTRTGPTASNNGGNNYGAKMPPPPPSYVQATVNAAREWTNTTPPSENNDQHQTPPHTPELDSGNQSTYSNNLGDGSRRNTAHNVVSAAAVATPEGAYHTPLFGQCEWIQPPPVPQVDQPTPAFPCYRLFLGQIRFETTQAEVKWIIEYVTGVQALKVETRGIGCFLAYFQTHDDMLACQQLHKRILFDHTGIWFARTDEQALAMQEYVKAALGRIGRGFRLPKDMMVVEEEKLQRALPIPNAPPQYANQQQSGNGNYQGAGSSYTSFGVNSHSNHQHQQQRGPSRFPQHTQPQYNNGNTGYAQQHQHQQQHQPYGYSGANSSPFPSHQYTNPNGTHQQGNNYQQGGGRYQQEHPQGGYSQVPDYQHQ